MPDKKAVYPELYFWGELNEYSGGFFLDFYVELNFIALTAILAIHLSWSFLKNSIILMKFDYFKENTGNSFDLQGVSINPCSGNQRATQAF